ncbi:MAG: hypothetical protein JXR68_00825 [Bacteroidales bacterium]|nr:hypothetical protein [Bacteroidales bacterium]
MKPLNSVIFFTGILFFCSCSPSLKTAIIGKWLIEDAYINDLDLKFQEYCNKNTSIISINEFETNILNYLSLIEFEFIDSNVCIINSDTVNWHIDENIVLLETSQNQTLTIKQITQNDIIAKFSFMLHNINFEAEVNLTRKDYNQ